MEIETTFSNTFSKPEYDLEKKEFKLTKDNIIYDITLNLEQINSNEVIRIKSSQVINNCFYLYELILDYQNLLQILNVCDNIKQGYQTLILLFKKQDIIIKDIIAGKEIVLDIKINSSDNKEIKLVRVNKDDKIIINELIEKYTFLEKEYINMKNELTNKNNVLKQQVETLNQQRINHNNYININNINNSSYNFRPYPLYHQTPIVNEVDDENHITINNFSSVWCMLKLNPINYMEKEKNTILNLVAIGFSDSRIILINISTMKIHQTLKSLNTIYSLAQFNNNPNYLLCSLSNGYIIIFKLKQNLYEEIQKLQKPENLRRGEINKVITLSNGDLLSGERKAISIWRQKKDEKGNKIEEFEFFKEIMTNYDTCQLVEVNPNTFACAMYTSKEIKVYKNDENDYPLLGVIKNAESNGTNSNGMARINNKLFCSGGKNYFIYIVGVEPVQLIQKIKLVNEESFTNINFMHLSNNNNYLFTSYGETIIQFKIIKDKEDNFIELEEFDRIEDKKSGSSSIATTDDGKIFYQQKADYTRFYLKNLKVE